MSYHFTPLLNNLTLVYRICEKKSSKNALFSLVIVLTTFSLSIF